jgi:hypothetical protein
MFLTDHEKLKSNQDSSSRYIPIVYITVTILPMYGQKDLPHLEIITFQQIMQLLAHGDLTTGVCTLTLQKARRRK